MLRIYVKNPAVPESVVVPDTVKFGYLYNWYAVTDARLISANGWEVPEQSDWDTLVAYLGGATGAGGKLKSTGYTYYNSPNTGATNLALFNGRGSGVRATAGAFQSIMVSSYYIVRDERNSTDIWYYYQTDVSADSFKGFGKKYYGSNLRPLKTTTSLTNGQTGTYTGNDGKVYRTICIGTQEWLADNLAETKYRNGDWITGYDAGTYTPISNAAWAALTTEALCAYNDDLNNV